MKKRQRKDLQVIQLANISSKGRVTIPIEIRQKLGISGAAIITFDVRDDGRVIVYAKAKAVGEFNVVIAKPEMGTA